MNNAQTAPKVTKETKNKIRVDFERTPFWDRVKAKLVNLYTLKKVVWYLFRFLLLLGISYVILFPFFSKISSSFMGREDFVDVTVRLIPKHPTLDTYRAIIKDNNYLTALLNTLSFRSPADLSRRSSAASSHTVSQDSSSRATSSCSSA